MGKHPESRMTDLRNRAENHLRGRDSASASESGRMVTPDDICNTLQELEVHKIELEMQNEELRRAQVELETARNRYEELYDFSPLGYVVLSLKGVVTAANITCARLLNCERGRLIGTFLGNFIASGAQGDYYFFLHQLRQTQAPQTCTLTLKPVDSQTRYLRVDAVVRQDSGGAPEVFAALTDVTDHMLSRRLLEQQQDTLDRLVRERTAELKNSKEQYRSLVESTSDAIYIVDNNARFIFINKAYQRRLGLSPDQVQGATYGQYHSKQETRNFRKKIQTVIQTATPLSCEYQSERDGGYFIRTLSPIMGGETVQAVSVMSKNISRQKRAEQEVIQSRINLAHLERTSILGEMAASISHELNQPLTAILSNAQTARRLMKHSPVNMNELDDILKDIISDDRRAGEFIRQLRTLFQKRPVEIKAININRLVKEVLGLVRSESITKNTTIKTVFDADISHVWADRVHIQQVLINLILNALESTPHRRTTPRKIIVSTVKENASQLKISVRDFGEGIKDENREAVFLQFMTTKKNGMGMGLAICKTIVESHNGRIWVENNPGPGATFSFTLPVSRGGGGINDPGRSCGIFGGRRPIGAHRPAAAGPVRGIGRTGI